VGLNLIRGQEIPEYCGVKSDRAGNRNSNNEGLYLIVQATERVILCGMSVMMGNKKVILLGYI